VSGDVLRRDDNVPADAKARTHFQDSTAQVKLVPFIRAQVQSSSAAIKRCPDTGQLLSDAGALVQLA
jgi:hypothetical protein